MEENNYMNNINIARRILQLFWCGAQIAYPRGLCNAVALIGLPSGTLYPITYDEDCSHRPRYTCCISTKCTLHYLGTHPQIRLEYTDEDGLCWIYGHTLEDMFIEFYKKSVYLNEEVSSVYVFLQDQFTINYKLEGDTSCSVFDDMYPTIERIISVDGLENTGSDKKGVCFNNNEQKNKIVDVGVIPKVIELLSRNPFILTENGDRYGIGAILVTPYDKLYPIIVNISKHGDIVYSCYVGEKYAISCTGIEAGLQIKKSYDSKPSWISSHGLDKLSVKVCKFLAQCGETMSYAQILLKNTTVIEYVLDNFDDNIVFDRVYPHGDIRHIFVMNKDEEKNRSEQGNTQDVDSSTTFKTVSKLITELETLNHILDEVRGSKFQISDIAGLIQSKMKHRLNNISFPSNSTELEILKIEATLLQKLYQSNSTGKFYDTVLKRRELIKTKLKELEEIIMTVD